MSVTNSERNYVEELEYFLEYDYYKKNSRDYDFNYNKVKSLIDNINKGEYSIEKTTNSDFLFNIIKNNNSSKNENLTIDIIKLLINELNINISDCDTLLVNLCKNDFIDNDLFYILIEKNVNIHSIVKEWDYENEYFILLNSLYYLICHNYNDNYKYDDIIKYLLDHDIGIDLYTIMALKIRKTKHKKYIINKYMLNKNNNLEIDELKLIAGITEDEKIFDLYIDRINFENKDELKEILSDVIGDTKLKNNFREYLIYRILQYGYNPIDLVYLFSKVSKKSCKYIKTFNSKQKIKSVN